ncbi:hypothetical protein OBBRIDRAFT_812104 [Obba rivulosa]|uniref:Helicase C-terminal domain-containing protein n=1 Tax=Obba rivulosa TaxID=1052685 RepID=A0A8E2B4H1_9APHY|nr:hypothetical protein OBBRIDRAFT_812104 [Obba rivulosa]
MRKAGASGSRKGQKSITSFFKKDKESVKSEENATTDVANDEPSDLEMDNTETVAGAAPESSNLPPIHDIPVMFSDLISRIPEIRSVAERLQGRKMRVATMCSGTESPLLALDLIRRAILEQHGLDFEIEHVFSCEIEPFKQAYIERNFQPPLLFRDVCELGDGVATTAYGALAPVPGDVDMLIAGTSCVDYSNLNNQKQDIDGQGESGRTFRGMMSWVEQHRPPLVILENVCSAPWDKVVKYFDKIDYSAANCRVDTKNYYIPHTRTRGYLLAVNQKDSKLPKRWLEKIKEYKRPASATLDAFLLPSDDPRIHQARQKLVSESYNAVDRRTGRTDWGRCESRHQRARLDESLGSKRPLTSWEEGGFCKMPDFAWNDWGIGQVERVWDLMDISFLRSAKKGVDPSYKSQVWNLSQNVDRTIGSGKAGICPCLTPSMIPYITNRGGPMVGLEALSMQGLPVDELLLTRETEDNLADLAGNAMSTTVVGTCMLAALILGKNLLKKGDDQATYEEKNKNSEAADSPSDSEDVMEVDKPSESTSSIEERIKGEEQLVQQPLDLASTSEVELEKLLRNAEKSARLCDCEGRKDMTDRQLNRCRDCGSSSCVKCGGRPEHNPEPIDVTTNPRLAPSIFARELKSTLPMSLSLSSISQKLLDQCKEAAGVSIPEKRWSSWCKAVLRATGQELHFVEPKRQEIWAATYQSPAAYLELQLHPQQPEWRLFAKPEEKEPANSELRKLLELPVGRFVCTERLFDGRWEFALPHTTSILITIKGSDLVPAWEARLGLQEPEFKDKMVHSKLEIRVPSKEVSLLERDISGTYTLLERCGTANSALHKREAIKADAKLPQLFMLLDPTRCGDPADDCFVFSISKRRYEYGETRPIICQLDSKWRQSDAEGDQEVVCRVPCRWMNAADVKLIPATGHDANFAVPGDVLQINISQDACSSANALLVCRVPLDDRAGPEWPRGAWKEVDKIHERVTFKALAWLVERIRNVDDHFSEWQDAGVFGDHANCERCAPSPPILRWAKGEKNRIKAIEDTVQAGEYERRLKRRPAPFVTQLKLEEDGVGIVRIGANIGSLMHRAMSRLPTIGRTEKISLSWRLDTDFNPIAKLSFPKLKLSSNKHDEEHTQPPSFKIPLRHEQLRSLTWMLAQEAKDAQPFVEEEISEAILEPLGWRAEGRAQRSVRIRGGVLADEVGYGKTAITLGLIDCASKDVKREFSELEDMKGKIPVKATLAIVPPHLTKQWHSEVKKFTGKRFKVVEISTASNLNSLTIEEVQEADIVIVASNLFHSSVYLANLEAFAGAGSLPAQDGRYFSARLEIVLGSLREQVDRLRDEGAAAVMDAIKEGRKKDDEANLFVPTKRLKGKTYREAAVTVEQKKAAPAVGAKVSAAPPRRKLIPEVVITVRKRKGSATIDNVASSSAAETSEAGEDSDVPQKHLRRLVKRKMTIVDDDEDEDDKSDASSDAPAPKRSSKVTYAKRKKQEDSDFEMSQAEKSSDDNSDADAASSEGEPSSKKKGKAKAAPKPKPPTRPKKRAAATSASLSDAMEVDTIATAKGKGKKTATKRKSESEDDGRPAKKQKRREDSDPWKLTSHAVKKDWTQMKAPPLEMFHFSRKVVDEYTYLDGKILAMVTNLTAERHWVLSGTPPVHDFAALKTISAFLDLHLGVDDDGENQAIVKKRRREQTGKLAIHCPSASEKFHSFRETHSLEWHAHRHNLGQTFLDRFVRQNIAEIDEIPSSQSIERVILPAAERAIYLELEHHLRALDMTVKRAKKSESDREKRLAKSLGESSSAEEALLKRCSHFDLDITEEENAMKACEVIVKDRTGQLDDCKANLLRELRRALQMEKDIGKTDDKSETYFREYIRVSRTEGVGDADATDIVKEILAEALGDERVKGSAKAKKGLSEKEIADMQWDLRELTHELRRLTKELVGRVRSLRFFTVVRDLQKQRETPPVVACPSCEQVEVPMDEVAVLSSCGHTGCLSCITAHAAGEECVHSAKGGCRAAARVLNIVRGDTLGVDDEERDGRGKHYGLKLERVIQLIRKRIPADERVLIFVQFPDLMKKVAEVLREHDVPFLEIKGSAAQKSKNLEAFQNNGKERVLLLNVMDESASGANLTCANHAVFLSPLLAPTQEIYDACETQAIGRVRRFGQTKHVHIWRFFSMDTIDVEIYEQRSGQKL